MFLACDNTFAEGVANMVQRKPGALCLPPAIRQTVYSGGFRNSQQARKAWRLKKQAQVSGFTVIIGSLSRGKATAVQL
jgi:hypothetical protein